MTRPGVVSVVIVNHERADDTIRTLDAVSQVEWAEGRLELIVVDDASSDGSAARIREEFPDIKLVELAERVGSAAAANAGVEVATGEQVAFLGNGARPDRRWLMSGVEVLTRTPGVACVASKVLDADGDLVAFVDAAMTFYGHTMPVHAGEPDSEMYHREDDVLFASSTAMIVDAEVFRDAGGFDGRYFTLYEDVDLCWRLWVLGYRVRFAPESEVHLPADPAVVLAPTQQAYLVERNALFTILKNYEESNLRAAFGPAVLFAIRRGAIAGGDDRAPFEPGTPDATLTADRLDASASLLASTHAVDAVMRALPEILPDRHRVQARRARPDHEIQRLFRLPLAPDVDDPRFVQPFDAAMDAFGIPRVFSSRRRVLVATADVIQPRMAGPGIRAWHMAIELSREHDVQLVSTMTCALQHPDFAAHHVNEDEFAAAIEWADVVIFMGHLMAKHRALQKTEKVVVADVYDPFHLEVLEQAREKEMDHRRDSARITKEVLNQQLMRADFFLCASEKQRDFWLGQLAACGRINPATYDEDESLESLIEIVPFGVGDEPPTASRSVLRDTIPGIGRDDKIILWGGGIYSWFDPLTLVRAVDKLRRRLPDVRLYFMGTRHPNSDVGEMRITTDTAALSDDLGLTGVHVFFNDDWVAYEDRANYLLEADIGVSTHLDHIETAFSFRTRILDYFWASLPVVATAGDSLAAEIEEAGAGITVPPGDVDALEAALYELLTDDERRAACSDASASLADKFRWSSALAPLSAFCAAPRRAPDLVDPLVARHIEDPARLRLLRRRLQRDLGTITNHLKDGDFRTIAIRARSRLRRLMSR